ncbi:IS5/IS1182 family transposase [Methanosphaerula palustris]|uniref:Transposase IS4 family protein n=1 Tax=Methanosphaerula palustris (strain ATCC BAA-1556 / DSM 19958 / E1-9c) TaxID=521011 RepID=B8GDX5_METPE|nr:transposase IS4 family protein [Methanosphaerula palustris E1-9c]
MISHSSISPVVRSILPRSPEKRGLLRFEGLDRIQGSKMSVLVERHGRLLACIIAPANVHDAMTYHPTLTVFKIQRPIGRPIIRPQEILVDAAYYTLAIRTINRRRGIKTMIPVNRRNHRRPKRGRSYQFDPIIYRSRRAVERFFSWVKAFRKISPRYERLEESFRGLVIIACILILWRLLG